MPPPSGPSRLPSEDEADRFFTDVPTGRAPAPQAPGLLSRWAGPWHRLRARWWAPLPQPGPLRPFTGATPVTGPRTVVRIGATTGAIRARAGGGRLVLAGMLALAAGLAGLFTLARPDAGPVVPSRVEQRTVSAGLPDGTCIVGFPTFTDDEVATAPGCDLGPGTGLVVTGTVTLDEGAYPTDLTTVALQACARTTDLAASEAADLRAVVPSPTAWDRGNRSVVCAVRR